MWKFPTSFTTRFECNFFISHCLVIRTFHFDTRLFPMYFNRDVFLIQLKQMCACLALIYSFGLVLIYVCAASPLNLQQISRKHWCTKEASPSAATGRSPWFSPASVGAGDPGATRFRKRRGHAAARCRLNSAHAQWRTCGT